MSSLARGFFITFFYLAQPSITIRYFFMYVLNISTILKKTYVMLNDAFQFVLDPHVCTDATQMQKIINDIRAGIAVLQICCATPDKNLNKAARSNSTCRVFTRANDDDDDDDSDEEDNTEITEKQRTVAGPFTGLNAATYFVVESKHGGVKYRVCCQTAFVEHDCD